MIAHLLKSGVLTFRLITRRQAQDDHEQDNDWKHNQQRESGQPVFIPNISHQNPRNNAHIQDLI